MPKAHKSKPSSKKTSHIGTSWQLQEAKAQFSHLIEVVQDSGMETITKNGKEVAVILSKKKFDEYLQPKKSLLRFFKETPHQDIDLDFSRSQDVPREIDL